MSRGPSASVHDEAVARENPDCALGYRQQRWERRSTLPTLLVWTISTRLRPHPDTLLPFHERKCALTASVADRLTIQPR